MAFRVVRQSKFRHVFGQALKRDQGYDNIRITKSTWDSTFCAVNPKYLAIITEAAGGGAFLVLPLEKTGRVEPDAPIVSGHKAAVLDIQWCPHDDGVIASASEDCTVKVWHIPEGGLIKNLSEPVADLVAHQRRVGLVVWHPSAKDVLLSGGSDNKIFIWDVSSGQAVVEVSCLPDIPLSVSWNFDGSRIVASCKDKKLRIIDSRTGEILHEVNGHEGTKPTQVIYLKNGKVFSTGFRGSERQYALWDQNLKNENITEIDQSNGVIFPFYDPDTNIIYLCGKGDSAIRYFEITDESPYVHFLTQYQSSDPQRGIGFMPKRGVNVNICEIARFYKLHTKGLCEVISMTVPRKSELFQDDLYPDTAGDIPAMTAEEWIGGMDAPPILVSMKEGHKGGPKSGPVSKAAPAARNTVRMSSATDTTPVPIGGRGESSPKDGGIEVLREEIKSLKDLVKKQEKKIKSLEDRLKKYEELNEDDEREEPQEDGNTNNNEM